MLSSRSLIICSFSTCCTFIKAAPGIGSLVVTCRSSFARTGTTSSFTIPLSVLKILTEFSFDVSFLPPPHFSSLLKRISMPKGSLSCMSPPSRSITSPGCPLNLGQGGRSSVESKDFFLLDTLGSVCCSKAMS
uniref:Putative secreted protein n=1 Tax=Anopheles darlingi TaxID=43151 RepID=A0A2M4DNR1_ANODA